MKMEFCVSEKEVWATNRNENGNMDEHGRIFCISNCKQV